MQPLIDADILLYEVGFAAEASKDGVISSFDSAAEMLDSRVANICAMVNATSEPVMYLTGRGNFRFDIAKRTPYKMRPSKKPFHYRNLKAYVKGKYNYVESVGLEADDEMSIAQTNSKGTTIICTRDKDLRSVPGWHYGWELHNQASFGPALVDVHGSLKLSEDRKSLKGTGLLFFYAQCLTGDRVDSIPGLGGCGAVGAFNVLNGCTSTTDAFKRVLEAYRGVYGDKAEEQLLEQGRLLWMTRYLDEWGYPVLWEFPND